MNRIWQEFVTCLREGKPNNYLDARKTMDLCEKGGENFRLGLCVPPNENNPKDDDDIEPGVQ